MIRLFVAVPVPPQNASALAALVPADLAGLKRVAPELLHVTLAFIGWIDEGRIPDVSAAVSSAVAGERAFDVAFDEVGRFPPTGRARVLWAGGAAAAPKLESLGGRVREGLAAAGIPFDPKPLRPHVTLARARDDIAAEDARALGAAARDLRLPEGVRFRADAVHVVQSTLTPKGPRYASRSVVPLLLP